MQVSLFGRGGVSVSVLQARSGWRFERLLERGFFWSGPVVCQVARQLGLFCGPSPVLCVFGRAGDPGFLSLRLPV